MFNNSSVGYMEGFDTTHTPTMNNSTMKKPTMNTPTMNTPTMNNSKMNNTTKPKGMENFDTSSSTTTGGAEGHNLQDMEDTIKKGVKSTAIPVTKSESKENFEPFSGTFKEPYSAF
jgi:hypothetical protein